MRHERHRHHHQSGFGLLELLVVLAIVAAVAAAAYPRLGGALGRTAVQAAALQFSAQVKAARLAAISSRSLQTLTIDSVAKTYWSSADPAPYRLAQPIRIGITGFGVQQVSPGVWVIPFSPDGSAADGRIELSDGRRSAQITVDWLTGAARIVWGP